MDYLPYSICRWTTGLHYADFLSLHYIVYESISCNHGTKLNYSQLHSYIHHRATYSSKSNLYSINQFNSIFNLFFHLIFHTTTERYLRFSCIHENVYSSNLLLPTLISILLSYQCRLSSVSAIKIKSSAYSNSRGKPARSSLEIISIAITNSRGLKTDQDPWCNPTFNQSINQSINRFIQKW